jgi:hypothetical protein
MHRVFQFALLVAVGVVFAAVASEPSIRVTFLYSTNDASSGGARGVFRLQNDQKGDVMISKSSIEEFEESKVAHWQYLSDVNLERKREGSPVPYDFYPVGTTLFQTWIPPTGGLYRLSLVCSQPNDFTNQGSKIQSGVFRVSAGPPVKQEDFINTIRLAQRLAQTNLINRIANADHIVITNRLAAFEEKYRAFSLTISGDGARNIVRTVSFAKPIGPCKCINSWDMKFYRETNYLADVQLGEGQCVFEGQWYDDDSGVLKRFDSELWKQITNR